MQTAYQGGVEGLGVLKVGQLGCDHLPQSCGVSLLHQLQQRVASKLNCTREITFRHMLHNYYWWPCVTGGLSKSVKLQKPIVWLKLLAFRSYLTHNRSDVFLSNSQSICCLRSSEGARSMAVLEWQLGMVGSAPWHSSSVHTSALDLEDASCSGVNCQRSRAFTLALFCTHGDKRSTCL